MQNSNLVLTAETRTRDATEPSGEPETLWGRMPGKMGDRVQYTKPEGLAERREHFARLVKIAITAGHPGQCAEVIGIAGNCLAAILDALGMLPLEIMGDRPLVIGFGEIRGLLDQLRGLFDGLIAASHSGSMAARMKGLKQAAIAGKLHSRSKGIEDLHGK